MLKILKGVPSTLPLSVEGEDGPLTLTAPPTVTVKGPDGASVVTGTATGTAGAYTYALPAQTRLGPYTAAVSGTYSGSAVTGTVPFEVVGGHLFSVPDVRAFDVNLDAASYSDAEIKRARAYVSDEFRNISGRAFTPRGAIESVTAANGVFYVDNVDVSKVVAVTLNGVAVDVSTVSLTDIGVGYLAGADGALTVEYEYGLPFVADDVKRAALLRARTVLADRDSGIPDRATSYNIDGAQYSLATAGRAGYETGVPEVDAILARYRMRPPGVA